jgi:hypothetical protein
MKWWRVDCKRIKDGHESVYYVYGSDWETAAAGRMLHDPGRHTLSGMECDPNQVPWRLRAYYELSTEELRNALKDRGWKVVLR